MIKITINDKKLSVKDGITIMEAARQNGIHLPAIGYDPRVSPPSGVVVHRPVVDAFSGSPGLRPFD